jgi:CO/xanthine dehydrogenase Mo-binding subunit
MSESNTLSVATHVGDDVQRVDDTAKLTGGAMYASDLVFAGMLHAQVKKSPHARAKIVAINTSKAENLPGVHAVLTGKELDYRIGLYVVYGTSAKLSQPWRRKAWISRVAPST